VSSPASTSPAPIKRRRGGTQPAPLTRGDILDVALALLPCVGVDGLTVRSVADHLGVSSPAVYHYFDGRDDLLDRLCELIVAEVDVTVADGAAWDDAVVAIVLSMDRTFSRYPGVGTRVLGTRRPSPSADAISAAVLRQLHRGDLAPTDAEDLLIMLRVLFAGWLLGTSRAVDPARPAALLERSVQALLSGWR
jgi:TetR/AcrR family transcriptional regulator, tetracycline repressor protein